MNNDEMHEVRSTSRHLALHDLTCSSLSADRPELTSSPGVNRALPCGQRQISSQMTVVQPSSSGRLCLHQAPSLVLVLGARLFYGSKQGRSAMLHIEADEFMP